MGQVGNEWQGSGIAADPPSGVSSASTAQLAQAMAAFAPTGSALDTSSALDQTTTQTANASPIAASLGQMRQN
jgi:hypothetical protein